MWGARAGALRRLREATRHAVFLTPGLVDAALSSLAGFTASLYAVRTLDGPELGAFSLYLSASLVAGLFAQQLLFLPAQIASVKAPTFARNAILGPTLWRGAVISTLVAPFVAGAGVILESDVRTSTLVALGTGAAALTIVSPLQDHVRSTLHLAGEHGRAALVSTAQLGITCAALGSLYISNVGEVWVPFSALAVGCAGSGVFGLMLSILPAGEADVEARHVSTLRLPPTRQLMRTGMALLPAALLNEATIFLSSATLAALTSAATLGATEAARIVARPVQAFSLGISRSLAPALMEAGETRSRSRAWRTGSLYLTAIAGSGLAYLLIAGWSYPLSPIEAIVPTAFDQRGLTALFIVATLAGAICSIPRGFLLGANKGGELLVITILASIARIAVVVMLATSTGEYALPLAQLVSLLLSGGLSLRESRSFLDRP